MSEFAVSTNLISWAPAKRGVFGWPVEGPEAEAVDTMEPGDRLIPKFAKTPDYRRAGGYQTKYVMEICEILGLNYEEMLGDYEKTVAEGLRAVPFIWTVAGLPRTDSTFPGGWNVVPIDTQQLPLPYSTSEFLRLRATPISLARQFKATTAAGRHVQSVPAGTAEELLRFGAAPRGGEALRKFLLVRASSGSEAVDRIAAEKIALREGDFLFAISEDFIPGLIEVSGGGLRSLAIRSVNPIGQSPAELIDLVERAIEREVPSDRLKPGNLLRAARQIERFINERRQVEEVEEFAQFYDRFINLSPKVSQALEIAQREFVRPRDDMREIENETEEVEDEEEGEDTEQVEEDRLRGLTVSAVSGRLEDVEIASSVLAEAVTSLRAGKHILLSGPPGTGKSTIAEAICRAVVDEEFETVTATADWTTFDTIGGYMPTGNDELEFEPGVILRCLERGRWLIVDELNRADIDKAFGPLFTLLSGSGSSGNEVTLPFRRAERNIKVVRAERRPEGKQSFALIPSWRLIGTLNVRDKAALFQLSFAFLRRFAVVEVPLPAKDTYRELVFGWLYGLSDDVRSELADAATRVAFAGRPLGPAILKDVASFTRMGTTATETTSVSAAYDDPAAAFLTAIRLFAVPQYEGAERGEVDDLLRSLRSGWDGEPPSGPWASLERALYDVAMT